MISPTLYLAKKAEGIANTSRPVPIEEVETTNAVVVRNSLQIKGEKREGIKEDLYTIEIDWNKNYYNCGSFGHMVYHCCN